MSNDMRMERSSLSVSHISKLKPLIEVESRGELFFFFFFSDEMGF